MNAPSLLRLGIPRTFLLHLPFSNGCVHGVSEPFRTLYVEVKIGEKTSLIRMNEMSSPYVTARRMNTMSSPCLAARNSLCLVSSRNQCYRQSAPSLFVRILREIQCSPPKRSLHQSPISHRKRKSRTSMENTRNETLADDLDGDGLEYGDEAMEYANDLLRREHDALQGHHVLVIQPVLKTGRRDKKDSELKLTEAQSLVTTLQDWSLVDSRLISAKSLNKKYIFGQGTFEELTAQIRSRPDITSVFLNIDRLSGLQKKTMEEQWGMPVYDRYGVVLQIFKEHASSREAKLQIALAELHFRRLHLQQETLDLDQQSGAHQYIGGGGETLLEKKQRLLRDKEGALRKALEKLKGKRDLLRKGRERKHFPHVGVVGYTNAGKTSLIKALTGDARLEPRDQLFATLDVTSHAGYLSNRMPVIYVDTVGFISDLPHQLIASFAATLEDVLHADLLVHVRDVSHPEAESQRIQVLSVLHDLGVNQRLLDNMIEVNNKIDLMQNRSELASKDECYPVSATHGTGLKQLREAIELKLIEVTKRVTCDVRIPQAGTHLSWLYKEATVQDIATIEGDTEHLLVSAVFSASAYSKFTAKYGNLIPRQVDS
nr:putative GTP-binding protein 6 isoform X1 [Lytechinus pictus]